MPARGCAQITVAVIEKNELAASYILGVIAADAGFRPFLADLSHLPSALNANVMVVSEDSLPPHDALLRGPPAAPPANCGHFVTEPNAEGDLGSVC